MLKFKSAIVFMVIFVSNTLCDDYSITPITTSSGLYYEKIGEVLLSNNNWEFVTSIDYKAYLLFYEYLLQQAEQLEEFCETTNSSSCKQQYHRIETQLGRIEKTHESLANLLGVSTKPRRVKRFWAEIGNFFKKIGGGIIRTIFGGGSGSTDLSGVERAISSLQNGQQILANEISLQRTVFMIDSERKSFEINLLKQNQGEIQNKITLLEQTVETNKKEQEKELNALKETLTDVQRRLKEQEELQKKLNGKVNDIENKLLEVDKDINNIKQGIKENKNAIELINKLILIFDHFKFLREEFEKHQDRLLYVVNKVNSGLMDSYIVSPSDLIEMLRDIQPQLPEGMTFPYYPNIENSQKLYNVITPAVYLFNYKLIFLLKIPLVHSKTFNFNKITSQPLSVGNNKFVFILPQEPYIVIDNKFQEYLLMSRHNFQTYCKKLETSKYICRQVQEISNSHSSGECEVALFKAARQIPKTCNKRIMSLAKPMFLQLQQSKSWIYVVPEDEHVITICNGVRNVTSLKGTGFIRGGKECLFRTNQIELSSLDAFTEPVQSNFSAPVNLIDYIDLSQYDDIITKGEKTFQQVFPFEYAKLEEVSYGIVEEGINLTPLYVTLFVIIVIVVSILGYLEYKGKINLRKFFDMKKSTPIPPQQNPDQNNAKIKIKLNNPNDVKDVAIYGTPSETDPDSEYLTVKFKVKADKNESSVLKKSYKLPVVEAKVPNNEASRKCKDTAPTVFKEDRLLQELRKLKPCAKQ